MANEVDNDCDTTDRLGDHYIKKLYMIKMKGKR